MGREGELALVRAIAAGRRGSSLKRLFDRGLKRRDDPSIAVSLSFQKAEVLQQGRSDSPSAHHAIDLGMQSFDLAGGDVDARHMMAARNMMTS